MTERKLRRNSPLGETRQEGSCTRGRGPSTAARRNLVSGKLYESPMYDVRVREGHRSRIPVLAVDDIKKVGRDEGA
ncbi:hypothetical protein C8R44DRAFT_776457 [Mycena epipterygia]|nr:hypothetical protein C8R44DRAFT_809818 [Mycena epipterygia]KAJ7129307.1 hypothetical protein C8R44DRAFT_776457 [Mycena epipterygia]